MSNKRCRRLDTTAQPKAEATTVPQREAPAVGQPQQARLPVISGAGGGLDPLGHAAALVRASGGRLDRAGEALLRLQRGLGNRHVQQLVDLARRPVGPVPIVQASLVVGPASDCHEQEADRVARQLADPATQRPAAGSAAQESPGLTPVRRPVGGAHDGAVDPQVEQAVRGARGGGQPLPARVRAPMERALGADFREVRLHTNAQADQFSRLLGARAFTTGQEIFFRQGEYHPDGLPGQRLLAHELAHVVQQTATVRAADGAHPESTAAISPIIGTAVIQRVKIDGLDTEIRGELRVLKKKVGEMRTLEEIDAMLAKIPEKRRTPNEAALAGELDLARQLLAVKLRMAEPRKTEPRKTEPRKTEPRTVPSTNGPTKAEVLPGGQTSPVPVSREPTGPESPVPTPQAPATRQQRREAEEKAREEKAEAVTKTGSSREARAAERQRQEAEEKAKQEAKQEAIEAVKKKAEGLRRLIGELGKPSDAPEGQMTWLQNFGKSEFGRGRREWAEAVAALGLTRGGGSVTELIRQVDQEMSSVEAAKSRIERLVEGSRQKEQEDSRLEETKRQPEEEVQQGRTLIDAYVGTLEIQPPEWDLLIRWVFAKALAQLERHRDDRITILLAYLKECREEEGRESQPGPWVELKGDTGGVGVRGAATPNSITLDIPLWGTSPWMLLTSNDQEGNRNKLVEATAKGFIHEAAHLRQLRIYDNVSHPFREPKQMMGWGKADTGIQWDLWPAEVKDAYKEFEIGGNVGMMTESERNEWNRALKGLQGAEYYDKGVKDFRARELVSHLVEVVYTWGSRQRFDAVFPKCAALLERVIIKGSGI